MTTSADQYHEIHRAGSSDGHAITHRDSGCAAPSLLGAYPRSFA